MRSASRAVRSGRGGSRAQRIACVGERHGPGSFDEVEDVQVERDVDGLDGFLGSVWDAVVWVALAWKVRCGARGRAEAHGACARRPASAAPKQVVFFAEYLGEAGTQEGLCSFVTP